MAKSLQEHRAAAADRVAELAKALGPTPIQAVGTVDADSYVASGTTKGGGTPGVAPEKKV